MEQRQDAKWMSAIFSIISLVIVLVGDRIYLAVQLENIRTRVTQIEMTTSYNTDYIRVIREHQIESDERIKVLETRMRRGF